MSYLDEINFNNSWLKDISSIPKLERETSLTNGVVLELYQKWSSSAEKENTSDCTTISFCELLKGLRGSELDTKEDTLIRKICTRKLSLNKKKGTQRNKFMALSFFKKQTTSRTAESYESEIAGLKNALDTVKTEKNKISDELEDLKMQTSSKIFSLEVFNKELKEKNTELQGKINSLVIENTNLKSKIASSIHQFEEAQSQLLCYKEKLCETDNKYKTAIKKNGGLRSVITKRKSLPALSAPPKKCLLC